MQKLNKNALQDVMKLEEILMKFHSGKSSGIKKEDGVVFCLEIWIKIYYICGCKKAAPEKLDIDFVRKVQFRN